MGDLHVGWHDDWRWASVEQSMQLLPFAPRRNAVERLVADIIERPTEAYRYEREVSR